MIDKIEFQHPDEEAVFQKMMSNTVFEKEILMYYERYVEQARKPDLYGKTIKVTEKQFSHVHDIAMTTSSLLGMKTPDIFVYEDFFYGVESQGYKNPWIEISAKTVEDFSIEELTFFLGKEMAAIKLGHTQYHTMIGEMLNAMDHGKSIIGVDTLMKYWKGAMYEWSRISSFTTDAFGYIASGHLTAAFQGISKMILNSTFLAQNLDVSEYIKQADQISQLDGDVYNYTKADERVPYGPHRMKYLIAYASSVRGIETMKTRRNMQ